MQLRPKLQSRECIAGKFVVKIQIYRNMFKLEINFISSSGPQLDLKLFCLLSFLSWSYLELFWLLHFSNVVLSGGTLLVVGLNFQSCPTFSLKMFPLKGMCFTDLKGSRLRAACTHQPPPSLLLRKEEVI